MTPTHDTAEISGLLDRYLISLDDEKLDRAWADGLFTQDAVVEFPMSRHEGIGGLAAWHEKALAVFERTQHLGSPAVIALDGDEAVLRANLISTHVHRAPSGAPAPGAGGALFCTGTFVSGRARRTGAGWRLSLLAFRLIWATGNPPPAGAQGG